MTLAAGEITSGRGGYTATKSNETGGVVVYLPKQSFSVTVPTGKVPVPLVNNNGATANNAQAPVIGNFQMSLPFISEIMTTAWFTRAFCSTTYDTDAHNYHTLQNCPDGNGGATDVHALAKFASLSFNLEWNLSGMAQAMGMRASGMIIDPYSGSVTALTAPTAGTALSLGNVKGFAQSGFSGATDVVSVTANIFTGLAPTAGTRTGTNSRYPVLNKGLIQNEQTGNVTIVQPRTTTTIIGATGAGGAFSVSVGSVGAGRIFTFALQPAVMNQTCGLGPNYVSNTYFLQSVDGSTLPFSVSDM